MARTSVPFAPPDPSGAGQTLDPVTHLRGHVQLQLVDEPPVEDLRLHDAHELRR